MVDTSQNPQQLTNPQAIKSIYVPENFTSRTQLLEYYKRFLEPLRSFPGTTEQINLYLIFQVNSNQVDKSSGIKFTQENRIESFDTQKSDSSYFYVTDLVNILSQIYSGLQNSFKDEGGLVLEYFSTPLLDEFQEKVNGEPIGLKESRLYESATALSTLKNQIKELLDTIDRNLGTSTESAVSSLVEDYGAVSSLSSSTLLSFLKETAVPLLTSVIAVELQAETSDDIRKRQVLFKQKTYALKEAREYINDLVILVNRSLTLDKPRVEKLSKLREKTLASGEFFVKNAQLFKNLAPTQKRVAYMRIEGSDADSRREFISFDDTNLVFTPADGLMSAQDRDTVKQLVAVWKSLLELSEQDLNLATQADQSEQDETSDEGGVEEDESTPGKEVTYSVLVHLFTTATADQLFAFVTNSSQIGLQARIDSWLTQYGYTNSNRAQLQGFLKQQLVQLVKSVFEELQNRESSSAPAQLKNTEVSFYLSGKNVYVLNEAYEKWFQDAYNQVAQAAVELFLSSDLENKTLPAFIVLQESPKIENSQVSNQPIESLASASAPDRATLDTLLKEYQKQSGESPTTISDWGGKLTSLKSRDSESYNRFIGKIITPQSRLNAEITARMEQAVLLQLQRNGLVDIRDLSTLPDNFSKILQDNISEYLLSLPPEKLLAALADPTARLQLLSEFNRRYLLRQVSSAQLIQKFILVQQVVAQKTAETQLDTLIETLAGTDNSLAQKEEIKKRLHGLIIASGYTPTDSDLESLDQKQIELLFDISFGDRKLSPAELDAFKSALKKYTDRYYFASQLDKEVTLADAISEQFSGKNPQFEQEKQKTLEQIATTVKSFSEDKIAISTVDLEKNIAVFIQNSAISSSSEIESLSKNDLIRILGLQNLDPELVEKLLNELDENELLILRELLKEYSQKFIRSFSEERAISHITRPISISVSPNKKPSKLKGEDAEDHGLLLSILGEELPQRTQLTDIEIERRDFAWKAYLQSLENQRIAIEDGTLLPQVGQWDIPLEEIQQYPNLFPAVQNRAVLTEPNTGEAKSSTLASSLDTIQRSPRGNPFKKRDKKKKKKLLQQEIENRIQRKIGQKILSYGAQAVAKLISFVTQIALPGIISGGAALLGVIVGSPLALAIGIGVGLGAGIYAGLNYFLPGWQASLQSFFSGIGSGLQSFFSSIGPSLQSLGSSVAGGMQSLVGSVANFGQTLASGLANGALTTLQGFFQSLGSGVFSNLAVPTFSVIGIVFVPMTIMQIIDSGRFVINVENFDVEESSPYIDITKEVSPSILDNDQVADLTYTITLQAKDNYVLAPDIESISDTFTTVGGTLSPTPVSPVDSMKTTLTGKTIGSVPIVLEYTIPGVSANDVIINNLFSLSFSIVEGEDLGAETPKSFQARASVRIGDPDLGCFVFEDAANNSGNSTGLTRIRATEGVVLSSWTETDKSKVLEAYSIRAANSPTFQELSCGAGPITLYRVTGRPWGGWALSANEIALYDGAFGSGTAATEYTLIHELGHLITYRNSGFQQEFNRLSDTRCADTYPVSALPTNPDSGVPIRCPTTEAFAESVVLYVVYPFYTFGSRERDGNIRGTYDFKGKHPVQYEFVKQRIFGGYTFDE